MNGTTPKRTMQILRNSLAFRKRTKRKNRPNGYVLHRGIVSGHAYTVIVTGVYRKSKNRKTGKMLQIWFLLDDVNQVEAVQIGIDAETVCRDCPFASGNGCYVT